MSDMIKFINTQNRSQNPRIDRFQEQTTQIDLKFKFTELNQKSSKELFFLFYNSIIMV